MSIEKIKVCSQCYSLAIIDTGCVCSYGKYKKIELEFEVCDCCGNLVSDGSPIDSEFNKKTISNNKR